ncbi:DUF3110 domain-containing protein [Chlorogloea sp. CCALA 695]|uniref:DUF3110 domain-containing protein n=1 Tax=Chlorogloea sp. CCALA 695 TaxID=2107693 RepID=UPI000D0544A2|nr:DUF3110 domain-containing protein [Chlorogloea sp. CCALA 695]PSB34876.1 DUF3110 domain-containing protein [Chlorogloea sp. CCALA 695]
MRVFVLLFNARTENEGIHTIQVGDRNKLLMFESEDDATRFALMLEAQDFPPATVERMDSDEVEEFCNGAGYDWELVPDGALAVPPESNVEDTDWKEEGKNPSPDDKEITDDDAELDRIRRQFEGLL